MRFVEVNRGKVRLSLNGRTEWKRNSVLFIDIIDIEDYEY